MSKEKEYQGDGITVRYNVRRCIHAGECTRRLAAVFDTSKKPWIQPKNAQAEEISAAILHCPSGALHFDREDGVIEAIPDHNTVHVQVNGPLYVRGDLQLKTPEGDLIVKDTRVALCRCGQSKNKPFCDDSHYDAGFQEPGMVAEKIAELPAGGTLEIIPSSNGPYLLRGTVEIYDAKGELKFVGDKPALCRCGNSSNKPFCDGTHRKVGFEG